MAAATLVPAQWSHLWFLGDSEIYHDSTCDGRTPSISGHTHGEVGILRKEALLALEPGTDRLLGPVAGAPIELEPKTMAVLLAPEHRCGEAVSSEELIHVVWHDRPMGENPVYKAVAKLRRAFGDEVTRPR